MQTRNNLFGRHHSLLRTAVIAALLTSLTTASPNPSEGRGELPGSTFVSPLPLEGLGEASAITITGQVVDETGEPMIGVTVGVKGTKDLAVTDIDGRYTIVTEAADPVLTFSYIGYKDKEVAVRDQRVVNLTMDVDAQAIDEVVVTALGIKREKKMLGYALQEIKNDALTTTGDPSITSALAGKVAGVEMNTASTGLGGSTKITIRGNS